MASSSFPELHKFISAAKEQGAQRLVRMDEKRVHNLSQVANEINQDYRAHDKQLPVALSAAQ